MEYDIGEIDERFRGVASVVCGILENFNGI